MGNLDSRKKKFNFNNFLKNNMSYQSPEEFEKIRKEQKAKGLIGTIKSFLISEIRYKKDISNYKKIYSEDGESGVFGKTNKSIYIGNDEIVIVMTRQDEKTYYIIALNKLTMLMFLGEIERKEKGENDYDMWEAL